MAGEQEREKSGAASAGSQSETGKSGEDSSSGDGDMLLGIFESETVDNPYLTELASGLSEIDVFDLLEQTKSVARQLEGSSS